jgi:hypothetical protein
LVADIFHEVDEEIRRERMKKLWERYGNLIVTIAFVIVAGVAGWRGYEWWESRKAAEAGASFEAAAALAAEGKHEEAEATFAKIAAEGTTGYRILARFREAAELALRDPAAAIKAYDALTADPSIGQTMQDLAAVRIGLLLADTAPYDEVRARLEPLTANDRPFRHTAREILALSAWRVGDRKAAAHWFDLITTDVETPAGTRARVDTLIALSAAEGKG